MHSGFTHESTHNESKEWYTPPEIFKGLDITFDLDPCSPMERLPWIPVKNIISLPDNGLEQSWEGCVWMNPPYGSDTPDWMEKFIKHGNGIALVFSRTDTEWFHNSATKADALLFLQGRIRFIKPDGTRGGTPGSGSMLVACGDKAVEALRKTTLSGWFVTL